MQEILLSHRTDLAIAEKADQTERAEAFLDHLGVVVGPAEQMFAAAIAAAKATAISFSVA